TLFVKSPSGDRSTMASFALSGAVREGVARAASRNGLLLLVLYLLVDVAQSGLVWTASTAYLPVYPSVPGSEPTYGPLPETIAVEASLLAAATGGVVTIPIQLVMFRVFVSEHLDRIPDEFVFHRLGWATVQGILAGVLVFATVGFLAVAASMGGLRALAALGVRSDAAVGAGGGVDPLVVVVFLITLVPAGIMLASFLFAFCEIAIRDRNAIASLSGSWRLARSNRLKLVAILSISMLVPLASIPLGELASGPLFGRVLTVGLSGIVNVLTVAVLARAYRQVVPADAWTFASIGSVSVDR
ncbi:MAG: hypothetical protein ACQETB_12470, partial [Halobacteriota archaeon]